MLRNGGTNWFGERTQEKYNIVAVYMKRYKHESEYNVNIPSLQNIIRFQECKYVC